MECCSTTDIKEEIRCDSETEDILLRKCDTSPDLKEKPLSPVLGSGICNRKFLTGRRLSHKKSRVKLSNKFAEYERNEVDKPLDIVSANETHPLSSPLLIDDSFPSSSDVCLLNRINRLEKFENDKRNIYRILVTDSKNDDSFFKKPMSPAPVKIKKNEPIKLTNLSENITNSLSVEYVQCTKGFKNSNACPADKCVIRENKSRQTKCIISGKSINIKPNISLISETDINLNKPCGNGINQLGDKSDIDNSGDIILIGFKNTTGPDINVSKSGSNDKKYSEPTENENTETVSNNEINHKIEYNTKLETHQCSLTQEICESGISNTQMLYAVDDILSSLDYNKDMKIESKTNIDDFKGFEEGEILKSDNSLQRLISLYKHFEEVINSSSRNNVSNQSIFSDTNLSHVVRENKDLKATKYADNNKHVAEDFLLPPKKRLRISGEMKPLIKDIKYETKNWTTDNKFINNTKIQFAQEDRFEGFSSPSGKGIKLSDNSLNKDEDIFNDLYFQSPTNAVAKIQKSSLLEENVRKQSHISNISDNSYPFKGFCSASGKSINISAQFLKNPRNIFTNDDLSLDSSKERLNVSNEYRTTDHQSKGTEMKFAKKKQLQEFVGASGKRIKVSDSFREDENSCNDLRFNSFANTVENIRNNSVLEKESGVKKETNILSLHQVSNEGNPFKGFRSASGKSINISEYSLKNARNIFEDFNFDSSKENLKVCVANNNIGPITSSSKVAYKNKNHIRGDQSMETKMKFTKENSFEEFSNASGKIIKISDTVKDVFNDLQFDSTTHTVAKIRNNLLLQEKYDIKKITNILNVSDKEKSFKGFCSAAGKSLKISEDSIRKTRNIFDNLCLDPFKENLNINAPKCNVGEIPSGIKAEVFQDKSKYTGKEDENKTIISHVGNRYANTEEASVVSNDGSYHSIDMSKNMCELNIVDTFQSPIKQHNTNTNTYISTPIRFQAGQTEDMKIVEDILQEDQKGNNNGQDEKIIVTPIKANISNKSFNTGLSDNLNSKSSKKRLGISSCKQIQIPECKLSNAKLIFKEDFSSMSPVVPQPNNVYNSTPVMKNSSCSTPIRNDILRPSRSFTSFMDSINITPIKGNSDNKTDLSFTSNTKIILIPPTKGNITSSIHEFETEKLKLEERLSLISKRQKVLESLKEEKLDIFKRPKTGVLYHSKSTNSRISLVSFVNNHDPGDENHNMELFSINPHNAVNVHFKEQLSAVVTTKDGAIVVPNIKDIIGFYEIENAFKAMPGVDPNLLPKGWIKNHYKWIVWKLASYENMFPMKFKGCLDVDNVIQQLKYRYDREIDKSERSALRKIYEKDDIPQKRMVLCVSNIKMIDIKKFELELSDGWYGIRTIIDDPLSNQISRGKIKVGTKLMITGAQLLNCDGCHPLEANDFTCLKINFNCTRRAIWYTKLGYQKFAGPFLISLQSVDPLGGLIGCLKICIARVYPFRYLEKIEDRSVWLNQKAEEIKAQKWENDRCKKIEELQEKIGNHIDTCKKPNITLVTQCPTNICGISCPKTLYEIMQNSNDPEFVQQNLSSSQREAVLDYHHNLSMQKQQQMSAILSEDVIKLKLQERDTVAVLKLLVMDVNSNSDRTFNFFIWRSTETHTQILKEGTVVIVENVLPKINGDLNTTAKTVFKPQSSSNNFINTFKRRLVQIVEFADKKFLPNLYEFDTVGIVVETKIDSDIQEVWIADSTGRLLLINVYEGPSTCLLVENLKRGEAVTICNLIYRGCKKDIVQAFANHFTVFSCYSQYSHLQEGLLMLKNNLPEDMENLLKICDNKIEIFRIENLNIKNSIFEDSDEDTLVSSRMTTTDIALSLIDLNKFT